MSDTAWAAAVNAWHKLWAVGANGDTIHNKTNNNNKKRTKRSTKPTNQTKHTQRRDKRTRDPSTLYYQTDLRGNPQELNDAEEYGDIMKPKPDNILRVLLQNVNCLPIDRRACKSRELITTIVQKQVDVALLTEVGLFWRLVDNKDKWYERVRESFRATRSEIAYNTTEPDRTHINQYGGTIACAFEDTAHRVIDQGQDPSGLGRWAWLLLEGKQHHRLRILSVYRPVDSVGPETVSEQHRRYLYSIDRDEEPRDAIYKDLFQAVTEWKNQGEHIIIGIDANEDVRTGTTLDTFRALGMKDILLHTHGHRSPPATCAKNQSRQPIDAIFATAGIRLTAGGYSAFNSGCPSDHRYLWLDISYQDAFGYSSPPLVSPATRRLQTKNPKMVLHYNQKLRQTLGNEGLADALFQVEYLAKTEGWSQALEDEYNRINNKQYVIRKKLEAKIRQLRMGAIPWSPKLQRFRTDIEIWSLLLKKRKGIKISQRKLRRLLRKSDITDASHKSNREVKEGLDQAFQAYKKAKEDATIWRDEFLDTLASSRAEIKGTSKETELQQLRTIERQRTVARNIKRAQGKLQRNATTQIYVNGPDGRRVVNDKEDIEQACIEENDSRFSQSEGTPPMMSPLIHDLGYLADTPEARAILDGTYIPAPETDQYAIMLLQAMKMPDNVKDHPMTNTEVTPENNARAWAKQKEAVSSEPEGLSFSHYKAGAQDTEINRFDALLRCLPYKYGFSPTHWQEITDVEILKKAGVYDIDKMRTITLMDAAYNMNNKQLGKDLLEHAENLGNLAREQYGSRKHHQSCTAATNKVLTMDLLRMRRQAGALCSNDAKSCYDRIVHNVAALSMLRQGAPRGAVNSLLLTLQHAKHKIRTGFGVSTKHYGRFRLPPLQGLGQGNGVAPTGWAVISTVLINMMRTAGFGLQIMTCLSVTLVSFLCYAFVDDTDLVHTGPSVDTTGLQILQDMQRFVEHWEGGLRATGGALRVDKSCWYLIDFKWQANTWRYISKTDLPGDITVRDADGQMKTLPRLEPHEAIETLGIFISMDGNNEKQVEKLRDKAETYAEHTRTGFLTKEEAWHSLHSTVMKTLEYPMEAMSLTRQQWDYIMAPILKVALPRSGIVRTFPRDVLYGPNKSTGMGMMHPYYRQYFKHLELAMKEILKPTITAELLTATMEQLKLEIGFPCENDDWDLPRFSQCLTNSWIKELLLFCDNEGIALHDTTANLELCTTADRYLMKEFANAHYTPSELKILNECRMFLRVISVSDLCTADLTKITNDAYLGRLTRHRSHLGWPRRPPSLPSPHWHLWQKALTKCFLVPGSPQHALRINLGSWLHTATEHWEWFFSPAETRLYRKEGILYRVFTRTVTNTRSSTPRYYNMQDQTLLNNLLPPDARLASINNMSMGSKTITGLSDRPDLPPVATTPYHSMTIEEILLSRPELDQWSIDAFNTPDDGLSLATGIIQGKSTAVSDGSYKDHVGTSGFILRGADRQLGASGANIVPGNPEEQSSYRSELAGISGSLAIIDAVCKKYDINSGSITIALDGEQALLKSKSQWPLSPTDSDFDLLTDIRAKIAKLPISVNWQWIEGHQDKFHSFQSLPPLAQDNVIADGIAKNHINQLLQTGFTPTPQRFGDEGWSISLQGNKMSHLDVSRLYTHLWAGTSQDYWARKHKIGYDKILSIDWDACGEAIASLSFPRKRRMIKHACGHFGISTKLLQWQFQDHDECPRCNQTETADHVLRCKDPKACDVWKLALQKLATWMTKKHTHPDLSQAILQHLQEWHDFRPPSAPNWNCTFKPALIAQNAIGWYPFLLGHVSNHWKGVQQAYYLWIGRQNTGKKWVRSLILQLFNISWDMWEHRNSIKHHTITAAKAREIAAVDQDIREEYTTGSDNLLPRDQKWFQKSLVDTLSDYDLVQKQQWLTSVAQARVRWNRRRELARHSQNNSRLLLRNWLIPQPPPPTPPP